MDNTHRRHQRSSAPLCEAGGNHPRRGDAPGNSSRATWQAAAIRIEQGRADAGRVEAGAAEPVHGAVRRHERGRLQISYQRVITNVGVAGHHAFLLAVRHRQSRGRQLDGPRAGLWAKTATILRRRRICRLTPVGVTCRAAGLALRLARRKDSRRLGPSSMSDTSQSPCIRRHVAGGWAPARARRSRHATGSWPGPGPWAKQLTAAVATIFLAAGQRVR